jgi:L-seryl-tRNA(Ser) seleniumtransferase
LSTQFELEVVRIETSIGGGSLPGEAIPSVALSIETVSPDEFAARLRTGTPRVIPFIRNGRVLVDMRTILPGQDASLAKALAAALV